MDQKNIKLDCHYESGLLTNSSRTISYLSDGLSDFFHVNDYQMSINMVDISTPISSDFAVMQSKMTSLCKWCLHRCSCFKISAKLVETFRKKLIKVCEFM